jgi:hypothetical protein
MNNFSLLTRFLFVIGLISLASCDNEFNEVGAGIIGGDVHNSVNRFESPIIAYDRATGVVQTNNLNLNWLGVYDNPVFGKTTAHFVSQLQLDAENPEFFAPVIDSVWLYVPFYNTLTETDTDGHSKYTIDSVYGDTLQKFRLSIKENGYYLRDADANSSGVTGQKYYSADKDLIDSYEGQSLLENGAPNVEFRFSAAEIKRTATYTDEDDDSLHENAEVELKAPGMFIYLDKTYFQNKILNQSGTGNLVNNNVFRNYIRGLYFEVEQIGSQSVMGALNFSEGEIKIVYTQNDVNSDDQIQYEDDGVTVLKESLSLTMSLTGNTINLLENNAGNTPSYPAALATANTTQGDSRLYVKGGEGSMTFIDILSQAEIAQLQSENAMINEANIVFYVDRSAMGVTGSNGRQAKEPFRVYLYDVNNKRYLQDYTMDQTTSTLNTKYNKYVHGGIAQTGADGRAVQYKIRITNHINNIITKDSTNVKLALVVTENINEVGNAALKTSFTEQVFNARTTGSVIDPAVVTVSTLPVASVINPLGIILYGSSPEVPEEKRAKLEIFYTKP